MPAAVFGAGLARLIVASGERAGPGLTMFVLLEVRGTVVVYDTAHGACHSCRDNPLKLLSDTFALEKHQGAYETWPLRTRLFCRGEPTRAKLAGYDVRWQFALENRFLLITDHDCPFEESYEIYLLDRDLHVLSHHADPPPSATIAGGLMGALGVSSRNLYCSAEVIDERRVRLMGCSRSPHLEITVLDKRPYGIGRLLRLAFLA